MFSSNSVYTRDTTVVPKAGDVLRGLMNYERSNSRKQGHVELMLYDVLCTLTNSIEISSKSRFRVDLRALVRSLLSMRRLSREYRTAGEINRDKTRGLV